MKNIFKRTSFTALALLAAAAFFIPCTQAASKSSQIEAAYQKLMNIEASLVTYNQEAGYTYSYERFYAGYSVDSKAAQTIYYLEEIGVDAKAELKSRKISTKGIKLVPVKYAYYQLHSVALSMENVVKQNGSSLGFTPVFGVSAEENKVVAYISGPTDEKKNALLKVLNWSDDGEMLTFKDASESFERSSKLLALLPEAVRASEAYMGSYVATGSAPSRAVVLLTNPNDPALRKLIDPFILVKTPQDAAGEYYDPFQAVSDPAQKHALSALYDSIGAYNTKTTLFSLKNRIPFSQWYYDEASGKIVAGIPGLNAKQTKQFQTVFGKSTLVELRDMGPITPKPG